MKFDSSNQFDLYVIMGKCIRLQVNSALKWNITTRL